MIQGSGLRSAYSATLGRIKAQNGSKARLGMEVLMWLSHSEEPLNTGELCDALGVEIGSTDLNSENIPTIETLLGCSLGLVTVGASSYTVRLVHYTLKEYLSDNTDLFNRPHSMIAEVCLTYLNFESVRNLPLAYNSTSLGGPFLHYASRYWGRHARMEITESISSLALGLLDRFDHHVSSGILLTRINDEWDYFYEGDWYHRYGEDLRYNDEDHIHDYCDCKFILWESTGFTGLHAIAYFGMVEIVVGLLAMGKWDLNETDMWGSTAILCAAREGHWAIVKILLTQEEATPDTKDMMGRTPLSWAAEGGDEDVLKILLGREDVTPDTADKDGRTPLSWAAGNGEKDVVKILLGRDDVAHDTADKDGRTLLSWAAGNGWKDVVKILLERDDVTFNTADKDGRTPFLWAAKSGDEDAVKTLLGRDDITPDSEDIRGRTPLSWPAGNGHKEIAKILLEQEDVIPGTADKTGRTPLSWAVEHGHKRVVEMLLQRCSVSSDIVMTDLTSQPVRARTSEKQHGGAQKRRLENQGSTHQSESSNISTDLFPGHSSEPSQRPSKRIRRS